MQTGQEPCGKNRFLDFLSRRSLRLTAQRRAIIETVFSTQSHFTADELLEWSRRRDKSVSRATVYRTLPLLTESGLVKEMDLGKDRKVYDPNYAECPRHSHIICQDCGRIVEFESETLAQLENEIAAKLGFEITSQHLEIKGSCQELRLRGACKTRNQVASSRGERG